MTDRFSPSLPIFGKVEASLVHRVADVSLRAIGALKHASRALLAAPALVQWRFDYRAMRLGTLSYRPA